MRFWKNSLVGLFLGINLLNAQTKISDLTELATAPDNTDLLVIVDVGAPNVTKKITVSNFLSSLPAANLTGNIAAARMSTNWGTAGTSACATTGGVMYDNGTVVGCDSSFIWDGSTLTLAEWSINTLTDSFLLYRDAQREIFMQPGLSTSQLQITTVNTPGIEFDDSTGSDWVVENNNGVFQMRYGSANYVVLGNSSTILMQDQTVSTGDTNVIVKGGAGEAGNILEIQNNSSTINFAITATGFYGGPGVAFSSLGTPNNGTNIYCTDCTKATPCASGGSGAYAKRINGAWDCD